MGNVRTYEDQGAAKLNEAVEVARFGSIGPASVIVKNLGDHNVVVGFENSRTSTMIDSDKDTDVATEDTLYNGTGAQLVFTGEALNNTPIIPGTVVISDAGSVAPDLIDRDKDGVLYTDDDDEDEAGTINYFTGALELSYPTGKAPGTGATAINADYTYQDAVMVRGAQRNFTINNVLQGDSIIVYAAADDAGGAAVRVTGVATWV